MDKYTLPRCSVLFSDRIELPKTFDAALPEYCPGIQKIVKSHAAVTEVSAEAEAGAVTVNGKAVVHVTYLSDQNGYLKTVVFPFDFEHTFDAAKAQASDGSPEASAEAYAVAVGVKPKGPRNMEIKTNLALCATLFDCGETALLTPESVSDAELHACTTTAAIHVKLTDSPEPLTEDITLDAGLAPIAEITDSTVKLFLNDIRTEEGMLKYGGTAVFRCTYRAESAPDATAADYVYLTKEIPVNGEIADGRLQSGMTVTGRILPAQTEAGSSFDPYGESRVINATVGYTVCFDAFDETEIEYFDDGYCAAYECDFETGSHSFERLCGTVKDAVRIEEKLHADRSQLVNVTDADMTLHISGAEVADGRLFAVGKAGVLISGSDEKGEPECMQTTFAVHLPIESVHDALPENRYLMNTRITACSAVLRDGEILLTADAETDGVILEKCRISAIDRAEVHYDAPKPLCKAEYIIYYPDAGETLWQIAKKYEIPAEALCSANGIGGGMDGCVGNERKTIVIPCQV